METSSDKTLNSGKTLPVTTPESRSTANNTPTVNLFKLDFFLRFLAFASAVVAVVVMVTSKETELIVSPLVPFPFPRTAKFNHSPAFTYFVAALSVAGLYTLLTLLPSGLASSKPSPSKKLLFHLALFDTLMAGIVASATGAAASIAYVGVKGNSHVGWNKICGVYGKFCRHVEVRSASHSSAPSSLSCSYFSPHIRSTGAAGSLIRSSVRIVF